MLVIFGIASRTRQLGSGSFPCPLEGAHKRYKHIGQSDWFSLFFIPILKVREGDSYVQCQSCESRYPASVLD